MAARRAGESFNGRPNDFPLDLALSKPFSEESHGLSTLVVASLLDAAGIDTTSRDLQFEVLREFSTGAGRIDLFLQNDSTKVAVENKVFALVTNDLDDYLNSVSTDSAENFGIVLSLRKEPPENPRFRYVTYARFFKKIRSNLGQFICDHDPKALMLLLDLVKNLETLSQPRNTMNQEFLDFVRSNLPEVQRFSSVLKALHSELRRIVKEVNAGVLELTEGEKIKQWPWRDLPNLFDVAVSDFTLSSGESIAVDARITMHGWDLEIFVRPPNPTEYDIEKQCLERGIDGKMNERERFALNEEWSYEVPPYAIAQRVASLIYLILKPSPTALTD